MRHDIDSRYWFIFGDLGDMVDIADSDDSTVLAHIPREVAEKVIAAHNAALDRLSAAWEARALWEDIKTAPSGLDAWRVDCSISYEAPMCQQHGDSVIRCHECGLDFCEVKSKHCPECHSGDARESGGSE